MNQKELTWWDVALKLVLLVCYLYAIWMCRFGIAKIMIWMTKP